MQVLDVKVALRGEKSRNDRTYPVPRVNYQRPYERRLSSSVLSIDVFDRITTVCHDQGEVLDEGERVDEVQDPRQWEVGTFHMEGFECG